MNRKEKAAELKRSGLNCAQSVALAFEDLVDMDEETLKNISAGFGAGGGDMSGTCGALSAVYLLNGLIMGKKFKKDPALKGKIMAANREIAAKFRERAGAVVCREIKGIETGKVLRSCEGCVEDAAELLSEFLEEK